MELYFSKGKNVILRPLLSRDLTEDYLSWFNDPEVSMYSQRRLFPTDEWQAKDYLLKNSAAEAILAICNNAGKHVGNIKFGPINWVHRSTEIMIIIGDKKEWGKGYAREAMYLIAKHLFNVLGLHRIEAGSVNPAFLTVVEKLGWKKEGSLREAYFLAGTFKDIFRVSLLHHEFVERAEFEP